MAAAPTPHRRSRSRRGRSTNLVIAGCLAAQPGCSLEPDPAVRLAYCVEEAISARSRGAATTEANCDLDLPGGYLVVLHPEGALREDQVIAAGLPQALLPELRELRLGTNPAIYVIATGPGVTGTGAARTVRSSWTTYQMNFVRIDALMVLAKDVQPVNVAVGGPHGRRVIETIR